MHVRLNNAFKTLISVSPFGIIGGGALLAGISTVGALGTLPVTPIGTLATLGN